jgi:quercetin dioxygenase-like cupin family protein
MAQPEPAAAVNVMNPLGAARDLLSGVEAGGHAARTLVREPDLRVVVVAMSPDATMSQHQSPGTASVHVLFGRLRVRLPDQVVELSDGELVPIAGGVVHEIVALTESAFVLTLAYDPGT